MKRTERIDYPTEIMTKLPQHTSIFFAINLLFVGTTFLTVQAEDKHLIDVEMDAAIERNGSTGGQTEAMGEALKKWDALLNLSYKALKENLDPAALKSLVESQRAWITWRDKELDFIQRYHEKLQGTMYVPMGAYRRMNLTRQRAIHLERMAEFVEDRI